MDEKKYATLKGELDSIPVPKEALSHARANGLKRVQSERRRYKRWTRTLGVTATIILLFVTSIRISPAFAQAVSKIPGFAPLVELIVYDKGIEDILKNEYYEELNITETKNDLTFRLLGIIADESGMIINYELEAPFEIHDLRTKAIKISQNNHGLQAALSFGWHSKEPSNHIEDIIEVTTEKKIDYSNPNFILSVTFKDPYETTFNIPFSLQKEIVKSKHFDLQQMISIDGQDITVKSLTISPLRAQLDITLDPKNTMQILQIKSMRLLDEKGEVWGTITNGVTGFGDIRENKASFFFQSNYFREPKTLTLEITDIQALPKGEDYIEVDFQKKKVLYIPNNVNLDINVENNDTIRVHYQSEEENHFYQMFSAAVDAQGEKVETNGATHSGGDEMVESTYSFRTENKSNPIRIYFNSYENYLKGTATVDIPLE